MIRELIKSLIINFLEFRRRKNSLNLRSPKVAAQPEDGRAGVPRRAAAVRQRRVHRQEALLRRQAGLLRRIGRERLRRRSGE